MNELNKLAQETIEDVNTIKGHPTFKPYLGFKAKIVASPSQGGNIRLPKKPHVTGTK